VTEGQDIELGIYPAYPPELAGGDVLPFYKRAKQLCVEFIKLIYYLDSTRKCNFVRLV
jgi:hypothetical protein